MVAILGILDTGISATAVREFAWLQFRSEGRLQIPTLLWSLEVIYWGIVVIFGVGFFIAVFFFGSSWFQTKELSPELVQKVLMLMLIALVVQVPSGLYNGGMIGLQRQVELSKLVALFGSIRGIGAVLVLWMISADIRVFFYWQIVVSSLQTFVLRQVLWRKVNREGHPVSFSGEMLRSIKNFAGGMFLISALGIIISQADKLILSRMVSMEIFGYYMLAWTVASGMSRVSTPIMQAFGPHFTELVSKGDEVGLSGKVHLASQVMAVLTLPPTAVIVFFSERILNIWIGDPVIAAETSSILTIVIVGTMLSACSYPSLSMLYSKKILKPVMGVNFLALFIMMPLLVVAVSSFGVMGGAFCWVVYGLALYIFYQVCAFRELSALGSYSTMLKNFVFPCIGSVLVTAIIWYFSTEVEGAIATIGMLGGALICGWVVALLASDKLCEIVVGKLRWMKQYSL